MARYIDADKMIDGYCTTFPYNLEYCDEGDLIEWLNAQPTADVAPRAEVARLQSQVNRLKKYDEERDIALHARLIANTRQEVAREIFEEIDGWFWYCESYGGNVIKQRLAELKMKYTENEK